MFLACGSACVSSGVGLSWLTFPGSGTKPMCDHWEATFGWADMPADGFITDLPAVATSGNTCGA